MIHGRARRNLVCIDAANTYSPPEALIDALIDCVFDLIVLLFRPMKTRCVHTTYTGRNWRTFNDTVFAPPLSSSCVGRNIIYIILLSRSRYSVRRAKVYNMHTRARAPYRYIVRRIMRLK